MGIFSRKEKNQERRSNGPAMEKELAPSVLGQLWFGVRNDGRKRVDWSIARTPRGDGELPYRTFAPRHLPACVIALARLAKGFSESGDVDSETRSKLGMLAAVLFDVLGDPYGNEKDEEIAEGNGAELAPSLMNL